MICMSVRCGAVRPCQSEISTRLASFFFLLARCSLSFIWSSTRLLHSVSADDRTKGLHRPVNAISHFAADKLETLLHVDFCFCLILRDERWSDELVHRVVRFEEGEFLGVQLVPSASLLSREQPESIRSRLEVLTLSTSSFSDN
jgi:hypothetical protein